MPDAEKNLIHFGVESVFYAKITSDSKEAAVFGSPVALPGAVALNLTQVGDITKFYADDQVYWQGASNNGYEGEFELALIPEQMYTDIWGMAKTPTESVLVENINDKQSPFALIFKIKGDRHDECYVMYNCTATRPDISAETQKETREPQTAKLKFSAAPLKNGNIKAATTSATSSEVRTQWFTTVWQPSLAKAAAAGKAVKAPAKTAAKAAAKTAKTTAKPKPAATVEA